MTRVREAVTALVCVVGVPTDALGENAIAAFGGWRGSGSFDDTVTQTSVRLRDTASFAMALDLTYDPSRQYEFFASHQNTSLAATPVGGTTTTNLPLKVTYFHIGGTNYFDGPAGVGPFVAGGLGLTRLAPGLDGLETEIKPSLSLALGYAIPLGSAVSVRFEGRGYWTLINSSGGLFCSGGCTIALKGDTLAQVELLLGISARF
ncbi:MAG TPA: hypothetical protein VMG60_03980 [Burkholderiaceae bacterium]|nr:hypothetical protein [Burkholderiaceae bacterium]